MYRWLLHQEEYKLDQINLRFRDSRNVCTDGCYTKKNTIWTQSTSGSETPVMCVPMAVTPRRIQVVPNQPQAQRHPYCVYRWQLHQEEYKMDPINLRLRDTRNVCTDGCYTKKNTSWTQSTSGSETAVMCVPMAVTPRRIQVGPNQTQVQRQP